MAPPDAENPQDAPPKADRQAYLEEQIQRQKRGEPIDVDWVRAELERVRREQAARIASSQRNLRWLVAGASVMLAVLWFRNAQPAGTTRYVMLGLVVVGLVAVLALGRRR